MSVLLLETRSDGKAFRVFFIRLRDKSFVCFFVERFLSNTNPTDDPIRMESPDSWASCSARPVSSLIVVLVRVHYTEPSSICKSLRSMNAIVSTTREIVSVLFQESQGRPLSSHYGVRDDVARLDGPPLGESLKKKGGITWRRKSFVRSKGEDRSLLWSICQYSKHNTHCALFFS